MEAKDYLKDIQDIKNMMSQSTQFISLSGLSGILAGIYALIGAFFANTFLTKFNIQEYEPNRNSFILSEHDIITFLFLIALAVILASIFTGIALSAIKAKKEGQKLWNNSSKKLLLNFSIPLLTGGIFALLLLQKEYYGLIAPITLLFYGLACVNASKFTFRDVRYLGITLIILGLLATHFEGFGLLFWAIGFGICHIFYGFIMYIKYDRK